MVSVNSAGSDARDLIVAGDERAELAAAQQNAGDAIGLIGGLDEEFFHAANEIAADVVGLGAEHFGCVQHD